MHNQRRRSHLGRRELLLGGATAGLLTVTMKPTLSAAQPTGWEPPAIRAQGFYQRRSVVSVGYLLENANTDVAFADSEFEVTAYDSSGTVLKTTSEYVEWIAPAAQLGVSTDVYLSEGQTASRAEIREKAIGYRPLSGLTVEAARLVEERFSAYVTGVVRNPFPKALSDVLVSALYYDQSGTLYGAGDTFLPNLPANGTAVARITISDDSRPSTLSMYAKLSSITKFV